MPLYEYYCQGCHGVFELLRSIRKASEPQPCPECDSDCPRIVSEFRAFTMREGYARKIPDDGKYWHMGQKVDRPITGVTTMAGEHPDLIAKKRGPPKPPTIEEIEKYEHWNKQQRERERRESGLVIDAEAVETRRRWKKRMRYTADARRQQARRAPNKDKAGGTTGTVAGTTKRSASTKSTTKSAGTSSTAG